MRKQKMMSCQDALRAIFHSRRVFAKGITQMAGTPRLVDGKPGFHSVTKMAGNHTGVPSKGIHNGTIQPGSLQGGWQIPMVKGCHGLNISLQKRIHQPAVKIQAGLIDLSATLWQDARPGNRETVGFKTQRLHQLDIFLPAVIMIAGNISCIAIVCFSGCM